MKIILKEYNGWTIPQAILFLIFLFAASFGALFLASTLMSLFS